MLKNELCNYINDDKTADIERFIRAGTSDNENDNKQSWDSSRYFSSLRLLTLTDLFSVSVSRPCSWRCFSKDSLA